MVIKNNAEFGVELALAVPYAFWLHEQGELETVITSKGMHPFYYFCDDVREEFNYRTIDNAAAGLDELPNNWIHHNALGVFGKGYGDLTIEEQEQVNGVLDYSKWKCPPYKEKYNTIQFDRPTVFVTNIYNHPNKQDKRHYHHFTIEALYEIFNSLSEKGYDIIYKRDRNQSKEITFDQNEMQQVANHHDLSAHVEGYGIMTDTELVSHYDNVYLFEDMIKNSDVGYNETQMRLLASCDKYISVCGGSAILSSLFGGTTIIYVTQGKELRPGYFKESGYFHQLSKAEILPVFDPVDDIISRGQHDISKILSLIEERF